MAYIPKQGDIVIMNFDPQAGYEQKGRRPALVVSNAYYNRHCALAMVCAITKTVKNHAFHVALDNRTHTTGSILCDQVRAMDITARNAVYTETVPDDIMDEVTDIICGFLE